MTRASFIALPLLLLPAILCACDRAESAGGGMPLESAGKRLLQLRTLTQLLPSRKTNLAVDRLGQIFWVQESETHQDVLFMIGDGGIPRATRLTTPGILAALADAGDTAGDGAAGGNIRAITTGEGGVYFFFYGFKGNASKACLGQYVPQSGRIRILAPTASIEKASGMGRSMELARASLVTSDQTIYLWLRHSDVSVFFAFEPRAMTSVPLALRVPFDKIVTEEGQPLPLTRNDIEMSPAPGGGLFLLDVTSALLWQVDRTGLASARLPLTGLPKSVAPPTATADGRLLLFAPEDELIGTDLQVLSRQDLPKVQYPALLEVVSNNQITAIPREDFRAHAGFPVYTLHLGRLVPETPTSYVSYDATSGALMRVKVVEQ